MLRKITRFGDKRIEVHSLATAILDKLTSLRLGSLYHTGDLMTSLK